MVMSETKSEKKNEGSESSYSLAPFRSTTRGNEASRPHPWPQFLIYQVVNKAQPSLPNLPGRPEFHREQKSLRHHVAVPSPRYIANRRLQGRVNLKRAPKLGTRGDQRVVRVEEAVQASGVNPLPEIYLVPRLDSQHKHFSFQTF